MQSLVSNAAGDHGLTALSAVWRQNRALLAPRFSLHRSCRDFAGPAWCGFTRAQDCRYSHSAKSAWWRGIPTGIVLGDDTLRDGRSQPRRIRILMHERWGLLKHKVHFGSGRCGESSCASSKPKASRGPRQSSWCRGGSTTHLEISSELNDEFSKDSAVLP